MSTINSVDPESLAIKATFGRGAWTRKGIDFDYRYMLSPNVSNRIGMKVEQSLDYWAVAAGAYAIQNRLVSLGFLGPISESEAGVFGPRTQAGVKLFQAENIDPLDNRKLDVDGTVGRSDARALFAPLLHRVEMLYGIPSGLVIGQTNHESVLDPGCVGYYIYYPDYRGVDRGMSQINSKYNPQVTWDQAYDSIFAFDWSAKRLRNYFEKYRIDYPKYAPSVHWDAALCAHNNPWAASEWAKSGYAPTDQAAKYVAAVKAAIF